VNDIQAEEQRNAQARLLDSQPLHGPDALAAVKIQHAADGAVAYVPGESLGDHRTGHGLIGGAHRQLAELLGQRHAAQQRLDSRHDLACFIAGSTQQENRAS